MSTASPARSAQPPQTPSGQSQFTIGSTERDLDDIGGDDPFDGLEGEAGDDAVHFCLLAEFDIDAGATLAHQYPYPTGTDEHRLAELMLPDGAHLRPEDWTVFYLGQTPSSAIAPMLAHENQMRNSMGSSSSSAPPPEEKPKRGVAGGGLLYVLNCVRMKEDKKMRRGAMVKAMAICTPNPYIGIYKPLLLLALEEWFIAPSPEILARLYDSANAISTTGMPRLSRSERILLRQSERKDLFEERFHAEPLSGVKEVFDEMEEDASISSHRQLGSSVSSRRGSRTSGIGLRKRSTSSTFLATPPSREGRLTPEVIDRKKGVPRDTHFFETEARFKKITVPIRIPMTVFDEDVGDYSLIELIQAFSQPHPFPPPFHPYLHTNGPATHPVILIINALLAHKRVMFLGHGLPANQVARMVLAACALVSGCGEILRGVTESAFPYANLASLDVLEEFQGYVAGVTNPRFEDLQSTWDVLCNLETGRVTVSKDLKGSSTVNQGSRSGRSSETSLSNSIVKVEDDPMATTPASKMNAQSRTDCVDNQFMEDILIAMASHFGESHIRLRFTDYLARFVRLASYHEYTQTGTTKIGYPVRAYRDGVLGSGATFADDQAMLREMWANTGRIEAWRRTKSYRLYVKDWARLQKRRAIGDFDIPHQISRLTQASKPVNQGGMSDGEAEAIFSAFAHGVRSYEQVVELLTYIPLHRGGLTPIANGLFHRWPGVRESAIEVLLTLQQFPVGRQAIGTLNQFHKKTFLHLLERREMVLAQRREYEERIRIAQHYPPSPTPGATTGSIAEGSISTDNGGYGEFGMASPDTVHGSIRGTPNGS